MTFKEKILIVDDESHIRQFVGLLVRSLGKPTVFEASNGTEALQVYERERPRMVLLDVNMPRMDGLETLRGLKQIDPHCCVIMLTSLVNRQTVEQCLELGAMAYLRKDNPRAQMTQELKKIMQDCFEDAPVVTDSSSPFPSNPPIPPEPPPSAPESGGPKPDA